MADKIIAAVMTAPERPIELWEFPEPDLPEGGALLATAFSEVCGTDVHLWHGRLAGVRHSVLTKTTDGVVLGMEDLHADAADPRTRSKLLELVRKWGRFSPGLLETAADLPSRELFEQPVEDELKFHRAWPWRSRFRGPAAK